MNSWFKGLKGKLVGAAILPVVGFALLGFVSFTNLTAISEQSVDAYERMIPNTATVGSAIADRASVGYFLWGAVGTYDSPEDHKRFLSRAEESLKHFNDSIKTYQSIKSEPSEAEIYAKMKGSVDNFSPLTEKVLEHIKKGTPEDRKAAFDYINGGEWHVNSIEVRKGLELIEKDIQAQAHRDEAKLLNQVREIKNITLFASLAAVFLTMGVLLWIAHRVSNSVATANEKINSASTQVAAAIEQLTAAGQDLSHSSTSAAASLEETVASLEEISSMVQMNSDNAKQAASLSFSSKDSAEKGEKEIRNLVDHMQGISQASKKIEEIINVIDDIAFQTNLLALNAAVEAARAGEQGKGFAVVAEAVRALAQRSASAAKDITVLIKDSVEKIEEGTMVADKSGTMMSEILTSVKKVSDLANEISAASAEQTTGIQQVSKAMNQLDHSAQSNAASSEEIASTSEEISSQAMQMQHLIDELGFVIMGPQTGSVTTASRSKEAPIEKIESKTFALQKTKTTSAPTPAKAEVKPKTLPKPAASAAPAPKQMTKSASKSAEVIPFDDDDDRGQVGDASGF